MERNILHILSILALSLTLFSCSKGERYEFLPVDNTPYTSLSDDQSSLAIGTIREREGVRFIQLDPVSAAFVVNPSEIKGIPSGSRVFLEYRRVLSSETPGFCTEAILVEWTSMLEMGEIRYDMMAREGDPVSIETDWITSAEDGFLTIHYACPSKGKVSHSFSLYPETGTGNNKYGFRLLHEANGDTEGELTDGIICFPIGEDLFQSEGTITFSLTYIDLDRTKKTLTIDYRSPK